MVLAWAAVVSETHMHCAPQLCWPHVRNAAVSASLNWQSLPRHACGFGAVSRQLRHAEHSVSAMQSVAS